MPFDPKYQTDQLFARAPKQPAAKHKLALFDGFPIYSSSLCFLDDEAFAKSPLLSTLFLKNQKIINKIINPIQAAFKS
jgi:hypothetical protein